MKITSEQNKPPPNKLTKLSLQHRNEFAASHNNPKQARGTAEKH